MTDIHCHLPMLAYKAIMNNKLKKQHLIKGDLE